MEYKKIHKFKECKLCGNVYLAQSINTRYCSVCRKIVDKIQQDASNQRRKENRERQKTEKAEKANVSLEQVLAKARQAGMSYGQYVAMHGGK